MIYVMGGIWLILVTLVISQMCQWKKLQELREDLECRHDNLARTVLALREDVTKLQQRNEEDAPERQKHGELLRQLNEEMERGLRMEKSWNDGLEGILNYSTKTAVEGKRHE